MMSNTRFNRCSLLICGKRNRFLVPPLFVWWQGGSHCQQGSQALYTSPGEIYQYQTSRGYYDVLRSLVKFKFQLFDGSSTFDSGKHMKTSMQLESDRLPRVFLDSKTDGFSFSQNDMEQHRTTWGNRPILGTESLKVLNGDTRSTASEMVSVGFSFCPLQL